jgi:transposase-like protein
VEGVWVVGGVERTAERRVFAEAVENRGAVTLKEIIERNVHPGSIIYTDCWRGYRPQDMEDLGMEHDTVNHTYYWVDPVTGVCTNTIEGTWAAMKWAGTPIRQRTRELVTANLFAFIWKRKNRGREWDQFLDAMKNVVYENEDDPEVLQEDEPEDVEQMEQMLDIFEHLDV